MLCVCPPESASSVKAGTWSALCVADSPESPSVCI